jgi:hypothetical protein
MTVYHAYDYSNFGLCPFLSVSKIHKNSTLKAESFEKVFIFCIFDTLDNGQRPQVE